MPITHFIRPEDTFESLAKQISLENAVYIIEYHNLHCSREDFIYEDLVPNKKLLLPDFSVVQNYNSKNDAPFKSGERNPILLFMPQNFDRRYRISVQEITENVLKEIKNFSLTYSVHLKWIRSEFGNHFFSCEKSGFSSQNDGKLETLAAECFKEINPFEICVNDRGELLNVSFSNEISENLNAIKEKLIDNFPDQYAAVYIEEFIEVLKKPEVFRKKMMTDWFLKSYFASLRNQFKNGKSDYRIFLEHDNSNVSFIQEAPETDDPDEIFLEQKTETADFENNNFTFHGKYFLDKMSGMIRNADISYRYDRSDLINKLYFKIEIEK